MAPLLLCTYGKKLRNILSKALRVKAILYKEIQEAFIQVFFKENVRYPPGMDL